MLVIAAIATFLSISVLITSQFGRYAGRQNGSSDAMAMCDAALDYAYTQWHATTYNVCKTNSSSAPASTAIYPGNGTGTTPGTPSSPTNMAQAFNTLYANTTAASTGVTCYNLQIMATDQNGIPASYDASGEPVFTAGQPARLSTSNVPGYPGWSGSTFNYVAVAAVTNTNHFGKPSPVSAMRYFQVTTVPLFQAAIFYENKLEIHPGADMIVTGLVHSNADIWARGEYQLQFKSNVSSVGSLHEIGDVSVFHGFDGSNLGIIFGVKTQYYDATIFQQVTWANGQTTAQDSNRNGQYNQVSAIDPFGGASTSSNGLHSIVEVPTTTAQAASDQVVYNNAGLRIMINDLTSPSTVQVYVNKSTTPLAATDPDYTSVLAALGNGSTQSIEDLREGSTVTVTSLDMAKLATATVPPKTGTATTLQSTFANSGTVYIHYLPRTLGSTQREAVRLINGRKLGQDVTVATDNGMYIQGDYNTGGSAPGDIPSNNTSDPGYATGSGSPVASGYTRNASAVMADAVTILSNNWNDSNSTNQSLSSREATPTTVNAAILAGDVASSDPRFPAYNGYASGGAHNFPRFLEDWGGKNFTYYGSLVEAFNSNSFIGKWTTGSVYNWPNRMWNFDINFLNHQPPGEPSGLQFTRGRWQRVVLNSNT